MSHKCTACGAACRGADLKCYAILHDRCCGEYAVWDVEWSDRRGAVCAAHVQHVYRWYYGDHEYDQTGLNWRSLCGERSVYEDPQTLARRRTEIEEA